MTAVLTAPEQTMVAANHGLISFTIQRFHKHQINDIYTYDDAWQDGYFGLIRAVQKFDPDRGIKFSTYAVTWIRQGIQRGVGALEGSNWRRENVGAEKFRLGLDPRPLSLDWGYTAAAGEDDTGDLAATLIADSDPASEAVDNLTLAHVRAVGEAQCRDRLDLDILTELFDGNTAGSAARIAREHGISGEAVRLRRMRLLARIRATAGQLAEAGP